jgi:fermentation-respiration switch protein FrsA (DUF1100 family)
MTKTNFKPGPNRVTFTSDNLTLSADLYLPKTYREGDRLPTIVITRPATGTKEQVAGLYAQRFSEQGFIALAFDPKGFGQSEGKPQVEDPFSIVSDTRNAVTYLSSLPQVDTDNIFSAGICMGAGYATAATAQDSRLRGTIALSPYLTAHIDYPAAYGGRAVVRVMMGILGPIAALLGKVGLNLYLPVVPLQAWMKLMPTLPVQLGMLQYYGPGKPGHTPRWRNKINVVGAEKMTLGAYSPFHYTGEHGGKPMFMAHADRAYSPDMQRRFFDATDARDKELLVVEDATHFDLYYKPQHVTEIVERASAFVRRHLSEQVAARAA